MAAQPQPSPQSPIWNFLSSLQQKFLTSMPEMLADFNENTQDFDLSKIENKPGSGHPTGLNKTGRLLWDAIEIDQQGESGVAVFNNAMNAEGKEESTTIDDVVDYMNDAEIWTKWQKNADTDRADIEDEIQDLSLGSSDK